MGIENYLFNAAERFPDKPATIQLTRNCTYREILTGANTIARWILDNKVQRGDRVGILLDDPAEYVMAYFGILMSGAVVVALNTQTSSRTLLDIINDAEISLFITHVKFIKHIDAIADRIPSIRAISVQGLSAHLTFHGSIKITDLGKILDNEHRRTQAWPSGSPPNDADIAQIIYTSGTTGKPKGVVLLHSHLMANTRSIVRYLMLSPDERHMVILPFFYSFGNSVMLTHIAAGATMIVHQSMVYPKVVLDLMHKEAATGLSGVPSTFAILTATPGVRQYAFPHLRYIAQAGGPMSPKLAGVVKNTFSASDIFIMYGQTEASARLSYLHPNDFSRKPGSIGKAIPDVTLKLLDKNGNPVKAGEVGEIVACGPNIMKGYWKDPVATAKVLRKEGLWTGDLAKMDNEGFLYIVSRKSEMIKSGAHRIGPREIEEIILEHAAVKETAVFGIDDEILGEAIAACIITKEGMACTAKEILLHCRQNLPAFKIPHHVLFLETFPKTPSGKVIKNELKNIVANHF